MTPTYKVIILLLRIGLMTISIELASSSQKFAMEPQDQTAVLGSRVTLPCRVIDKVGILQWTKDDFGLGTHRNLTGFERYSMIGSDEEGDFSLDIYPVSLEDDGRYQCQVSPGNNGEPGLRSRFASLTVLVPPEPPKIVQGDFMVTTEDREIELECVSYGGKPAAELTWIDGHGNVLNDGIEYIIEELPDKQRFVAKSILKLTPRKLHHNTSFTCQAQNTAERTHRSAKLKLEVKFAPKVTVTVLSGVNQSGRISEGSEVRLGCKADANPTSVTYKWFLNDEPVVGDFTTELVLHNVSRKYHDAILKCEVHNAVGKSEESYTLDVTYGPQFRTKPRSVQAEPGSTVILTCDVDGNPFPDITWYREDKKVTTSPNLTLRVDQGNAGRYHCKAQVPGFLEIEADAAVYLKGPPSIVSHHTQFGIEGDNVRVECIAFSIPVPDRVVWTFDGREIDLENPHFSIMEDPVAEGVKSTLVIREAEEEYFGNYNCSVSNPYGTDMVQITLMPQKNFPMLIVVIGVVGAIILLIIVVMIIVLCQRQGSKKQHPTENVSAMEKQCKESDRSSNISDLKLDLRTGSSNSNMHCDMDYIPGAESETGSESVITRIGVPLAGPVSVAGQEIYRYSADYMEPSFPPKDGQNNNGYVPYVDYSRDYNPPVMQPPISTSIGGESLQSTRLQLNSLQNHQLYPGNGNTLPLNDLSGMHYKQESNSSIPGIDPRFSATYGNPYLRNHSVGLPTPNTANPTITPAPPPYSRENSRLALSSNVSPVNTLLPNSQVSRLPSSPNSQYIVPSSTIKRGTLATHV